MAKSSSRPAYAVTFSLTRPPNLGDPELIGLLRQEVQEAMCVELKITARGMVVECETAALSLLETAIRAKLEAHGGTLESMRARRI
jgi:hypothetical protein